MRSYQPVVLPGLPRFTGGAVGFVGYEYVTRIEPTVPAAPAGEFELPLLYFMLADSLLIFDRAKQTLRLCVNAHVRGDPDAAYNAAETELNELYGMLRQPRDPNDKKAIDESTDTYDTIEWLVRNIPNNNGRVGMAGTSYGAWLTVMGALDPHPALKAAVPQSP